MAGTTEYGGMDGPAGIDPRNRTPALTASEKLMLFYRTGTEKADAPLDPVFFHGESQARLDRLNERLKA